MHAIRCHLVVICLLAGLGQSATAQPREPERGLNKSAVETRFGAPERIEGPVGQPPITKWIYADFIVFFEYDHVVDTVQRRPVVEQSSGNPSSPADPPASPPATGTDGAAPDRQSDGDILTIP